MDMCCWILSWRLCCLCNNLWTCTEFYINFKQFLKTELLWTQTSLKGIKGKKLYDIANRTCYIWKTFWRVCFSNFWREILIKKNWFYNTVPCLQQIILSSTAADKRLISRKIILCTIVGVSCLSFWVMH